MKFSLDFDGVLTDIAVLDLAVVEKHCFFWPARSVDYFPLRRGIRQAAAFLQCFGEIIITTARPSFHSSWIRAWLRFHAPELESIQIISSGDCYKPETLKLQGVDLHIDDDFMHAVDERATKPLVLIWSNESPSELLLQLVRSINSLLQHKDYEAEDPILIAPLSLHSSTPTFRVDYHTHSVKIRIFQHPMDLLRVKQFYTLAFSLTDEVFLPEVVSWRPLSAISRFVDGTMAVDSSPSARGAALPLLAEFLAKLHSSPLAAEVQDDPDNETFCHVSCAIDQFNVCLTSDGRLSLIDTCDCVVASPWLDIVWAEQLYCENDNDRMAFVSHYFHYSPRRPTQDEVLSTLKEYYSWLHFIVASGHLWNAGHWVSLEKNQSIATLRARVPQQSALMIYSTSL